MHGSLRTLGFAILLLVLSTGEGWGQEPADSLRGEFLLPLPPTAEVMARGERIGPGISIGSPTGFGARQGDAFVGVAYQARTRTFTRQDGAAGAGLGFGDPERWVGLEAVITTFVTVRTCCRGGVSFKVHRRVSPGASVALGWENALLWRDGDPPATDAGTSLYAAATKVFGLRGSGSPHFSTLTLTVGAGNGRFRRERDILEDRSAINPFGAASLRVVDRASVLADWSGQDLAAGVSIIPLSGRPLFVTPAVADLTTRPRFVVGAGYGFSYSGLLF